MASPFREDDDLGVEQAQDLALAASYQQMADTAAWKDLAAAIKNTVEEAQNDLLGYIDGDPNKTTYLLTRWQQRLAVQRWIDGHVDTWLRAHKDMTTPSEETE